MYTPLYIKTDYSLLQSLIKIDDLIMFSLKNNIKSLGICDNNLNGVIEFYNKCLKNNIKPIIGLNIKVEGNTIILYAKNYDGYMDLIHILSKKEEKELNYDDLYSDNLICILPYESKNIEEKLKFKDLFIGFSNKEEEKTLGDNKIYLKETLCLNIDDNKYLNYLKAIKENKLENITYNNHIELDLNYDLTNNYKIYDMCNIELKFHQSLIPKYNCPNNMTSYEYLKKLCIDGLKKIFGDSVGRKYIDRLKYELSVINEMNFCDYFLIVWDYVRFAKENGILVGPGRGSAASSLVSYCLNIIEIDPLKYNLIFERFLNKDRVTMPDIDIDFDGERIDEVIDYCKNKYGSKNVASIITYSTLSTKQVLRDVGKILNMEGEAEYFAKMFDRKDSIMTNFNNSDQIKNHLLKNPELKKLFAISLKLENIKKHISVHASGVIISKENIDNIIPLVKYNDSYLTGYPAEYLEDIGLIKMDFLSLKTLTTINNLLTNIDIDFNDIPLDDIDTINVFKTGNTLGIFQFESNGMISFLKRFKPNSFEEVYNVMALYRPGPMDNIDHFIKRRNKVENINYYDKRLEPILRSTYGVIVYQEQIMQIAHIMASYTLGEADILRRAMSKKKEDILLKEKEKFINRSIQNGYTKEIATEVYDMILKFAEYGFAKAHAVAYSILSYKMAYIKAHYPLIFMKDMLDSAIGSKFDTKERIANAKDNGVKIYNPDINKSGVSYEIYIDHLIYPLVCIKDVSIFIVNHLNMVKRDGLFKDIFDFVKRIDLNIVTKESIIGMIYVGTFDSFNINRHTLIENIDIILNYADLVSDLNDDNIEVPNIIEYTEYTNSELMKLEYEYLGLYLNNHPVTEYRKKYNLPFSTNSVSAYVGRNIKIVGKVERYKKITTKKGDDMVFMRITDEYGNMNTTIFSSVLPKIPDVQLGDIVLVYGKPNRREGRDQIIVDNIKIIDKSI